jgi:hypothetical protein
MPSATNSGTLFRVNAGEHVHIIGPQPLQTAIHGIQNMFFGKVETILANANFGLQDHLLPQAGVHIQRFGKFLLRFSTPVNIGMIKEVNAFVQRCVD